MRTGKPCQYNASSLERRGSVISDSRPCLAAPARTSRGLAQLLSSARDSAGEQTLQSSSEVSPSELRLPSASASLRWLSRSGHRHQPTCAVDRDPRERTYHPFPTPHEGLVG